VNGLSKQLTGPTFSLHLGVKLKTSRFFSTFRTTYITMILLKQADHFPNSQHFPDSWSSLWYFHDSCQILNVSKFSRQTVGIDDESNAETNVMGVNW